VAIVFLRHASLAKSEQKKYHGWSDIAIDEELFDVSKAEELKSFKFDLVISSYLLRCTQTLDRVNLNYVTDRRLREVCFKKEIEGKSFEEVEALQSYSSEHLLCESSWHNYICSESKSEFQKRLREFLGSLPKVNILICSHKGAILEMLNILGYEIKNINYLEHIGVDIEL